jgi:uncharacterized membrane protein YhaH (DUF805 family)
MEKQNQQASQPQDAPVPSTPAGQVVTPSGAPGVSSPTPTPTPFVPPATDTTVPPTPIVSSSQATGAHTGGMFGGRLNRISFFLAWAYMALYFVVAGVLVALGGNSSIMSIIGIVLGIIGVLFFILVSISAYIRRLHDLGKPGILTLITLVPIISFLFYLYLVFASGTQGSNQYGDPDTASPSIKKVFFGA